MSVELDAASTEPAQQAVRLTTTKMPTFTSKPRRCTLPFVYRSRNQDGLLSAANWFLSLPAAAIFSCNCRKDATLTPEVGVSLEREV
jgi:hypothetical protein